MTRVYLIRTRTGEAVHVAGNLGTAFPRTLCGRWAEKRTAFPTEYLPEGFESGRVSLHPWGCEACARILRRQLTDAREARRASFLADCREAGRAAGSWVVDGNTSSATAAAILAGIADGDPATLDALPAPSWGGEWADEPTFEQLARDAGLDEADADAIYAEALDAWSSAMVHEVERSALVLAGGAV